MCCSLVRNATHLVAAVGLQSLAPSPDHRAEGSHSVLEERQMLTASPHPCYGPHRDHVKTLRLSFGVSQSA
ncbi:unnamed protein product [Lota lota]